MEHENSHGDEHLRSCPFCPVTKVTLQPKAYAKHVGRHLCEISLAALPQGLDEDQSSESSASNGDDQMKDLLGDTQFNMAIHGPGKLYIRIALLDTSSDINYIPLRILEELGLSMTAYGGPSLHLSGSVLYPLGQCSFDWHVCRKMKTYNTTFLVLPDTGILGGVMLGRNEIKKLKFYKQNAQNW